MLRIGNGSQGGILKAMLRDKQHDYTLSVLWLFSACQNVMPTYAMYNQFKINPFLKTLDDLQWYAHICHVEQYVSHVVIYVMHGLIHILFHKIRRGLLPMLTCSRWDWYGDVRWLRFLSFRCLSGTPRGERAQRNRIMAILRGLQLHASINISKLLVESDYLLMVKVCYEENAQNSRFGILVSKIRTFRVTLLNAACIT